MPCIIHNQNSGRWVGLIVYLHPIFSTFASIGATLKKLWWLGSSGTFWWFQEVLVEDHVPHWFWEGLCSYVPLEYVYIAAAVSYQWI